MLNPSLLLAEPGQFQGRDVYIRLFLILLLAGILWIAAVAGQYNGRAKGFWKYLSVPVVAAAAVWGKQYFDYARDSFNNAAGAIGGNSKTAYQVALILPLIILIAMIIINVLIDKKLKRDRATDY